MFLFKKLQPKKNGKNIFQLHFTDILSPGVYTFRATSETEYSVSKNVIVH